MGSMMAKTLGVNSDYKSGPHQAGNAYDQKVLTDELAKRNEIYGDQKSLAGMLKQNAEGGGPNPAQAQYQQNVNQNIANTQGLISSQRGLNPAVAAKMGANAASTANQQAAGNASILQQQQQLGAQNNLGNLYGQMQSGTMTQQGLYNQSNLGAMQTNAAQALANQQAKQALVGGTLGGIGSMLGMAHGGQVPQYMADGGVAGMAGDDPIKLVPTTPAISNNSGGAGNDGNALSYAGQYLNSGGGGGGDSQGSALATNMAKFVGGVGGGGIIKMIKKKVGMDKPTSDLGFAGNSTPSDSVGGASAMAGGPMDAMGAGAEGAGGLGSAAMMLAAHGGMAQKNLKNGGRIGGKAKVKGDNLKNDSVPAMLSPGEIVVPRSITLGNDAPDKARAFVAAILAKNGGMRRK